MTLIRMGQMIVIFRRTGQKRYDVVSKRESFPDMERHSAPGYDPLIPHDLMHLVVESQLGLKRGIFGQLAAGGDAGGFEPVSDPRVRAQTSGRARSKLHVRGKKLLRQGHDDLLDSERATTICLYEWLARSKSPELVRKALVMRRHAAQRRDVAADKEINSLIKKKLDDICRHLDELTAEWTKLQVGEALAVSWPDLAVATDLSVVHENSN